MRDPLMPMLQADFGVAREVAKGQRGSWLSVGNRTKRIELGVEAKGSEVEVAKGRARL